jgi:hypothetical protein
MTPFPANWGMLLDPEFQRQMRGKGLYGYSPAAALQEAPIPERQQYAGVDLQNPSTVPAGDPSIPPLNLYDTYDQHNQAAYPYPPSVGGFTGDGGTTRIDPPASLGQDFTSAPAVGVTAKKNQFQMDGAVPISLLAAGLGILANNTGHYGAAGPAIGKGGLVGVQAYGQERDRMAQQAQLKEQNRMRDEQLAINRKQAGFLDRKATRQETIDVEFADARKALFNAKTPEERQRAAERLAALSDNPESLLKMFGTQKKDEYTLEGVRYNSDGIPFAGEFTRQEGDTTTTYRYTGPNKYEKVATGKKGPSTVVDLKVDTRIPFSEQVQKEQAKALQDNYNKLADAPAAIENFQRARETIPKAGAFVGPFADTKAKVISFVNTSFGTSIRPEEIANSGELQTRLFQQVMDNLKKLDAQPSQLQQQIMMDAFGRITTDPGAMDRILQVAEDMIRSKVSRHNKDYENAAKEGKFAYPMNIDLPPTYDQRKKSKTEVRRGVYQGKTVIEYSDGTVEYAQ